MSTMFLPNGARTSRPGPPSFGGGVLTLGSCASRVEGDAHTSKNEASRFKSCRSFRARNASFHEMGVSFPGNGAFSLDANTSCHETGPLPAEIVAFPLDRVANTPHRVARPRTVASPAFVQ
jgi:hypothetical protein